MHFQRISVVIPTYNRANLVVKAVESVLGQTHAADEVLVIDDGSTDDTRERLTPYLDRMRYVRQENAGPAAAKNRGLRETTGDVVGFLDSDDLWKPQTLALVTSEFRARPDTGLLSVMAREIRADGRPTNKVYGKHTPGTDYTTAGLLHYDSGGCSWFFVRRDALERVDGFDESLRSAEECDLSLRLSFDVPLRAIRQPLLLRRKHAGNLSEDMRLNARCWIRLLEKLHREHPEFVREHPWVYRRALAKQRLRLGRELLVHEAHDPRARAESRRELRSSLATYPFFLRTLTYLVWSVVAPSALSRWRRFELRARR